MYNLHCLLQSTNILLKSFQYVLYVLQLLWGFIESDFLTFAIPNTIFGIFGAFASPILVKGPSSSSNIGSLTLGLGRIPSVIAFNVGNLLVFDLANQRAPQSVTEDRVNKPWRPIPQGKITTNQTRRLLLAVIPGTLILNYVLGAWRQGVFISVLSWMYNDLEGGDEALIRELIIAVAYGLFNSGSLAVAVGQGHSLNSYGIAWTIIISGVILTTMQVQDLKDRRGDETRSRKTIALFLGERFSRVSIAFFVGFWSCVCMYFWALGPITSLFIFMVASVVVTRVLCIGASYEEDARTWRWWCFWHASLYVLPFVVVGRFTEQVNALSD